MYLLGFAGLVIVTLINVPLAGYELEQLSSRDWNFRQSQWWDPVVPKKKNGNCQSAKLAVGTKFRTDNDLFSWEIVKLLERDTNITKSDDFGLATGWKTAQVNGTLEYRNVPLDMCDIYAMFFKMDMLLFRTNVVVSLMGRPSTHDVSPIPLTSMQIDVFCDLPLPMIIRTNYRTGIAVSDYQIVDDASYYEQNVVEAESVPFRRNLTEALRIAGTQDLILRSLVYGPTPALFPIQLNGFVANLDWCPMNRAHLPECASIASDVNGSRILYGVEHDTYANYTILESSGNTLATTTPPSDSMIWNASFRSGVQTFHNMLTSAVRTDFGGVRANNMFQNLDAFEAQLFRPALEETLLDNNPNAPGFGTLKEAQEYLASNESSLPIAAEFRQPTRIVTNYICSRRRIKTAPTFIFNVAAASLAIFGTLWVIIQMLAFMLLQRQGLWKDKSE